MLNRALITGRIASDFKTIQVNGVTKLLFTICNDQYINGENRPNFLQCEAWEKGADLIVKNFAKGDPITVEGPVRADEWDDKDGARKKRAYIRVERHHPHPFARRRDGAGAGEGNSHEPAGRNLADDHVPF